tara:strand:- start:1197 stop:1697 length:501 start_codon:yes stop_codon:yes gene_type:complete
VEQSLHPRVQRIHAKPQCQIEVAKRTGTEYNICCDHQGKGDFDFGWLERGTMLTEKHFDMWIELLRNGKFRQTIGQLKTPQGAYCPLGLLAEHVLNIHIDQSGTFATMKKGDELGKMSAFPADLIKHSEQEEINKWNDNDALSFKEIAELLERNRTKYVRDRKEKY